MISALLKIENISNHIDVFVDETFVFENQKKLSIYEELVSNVKTGSLIVKLSNKNEYVKNIIEQTKKNNMSKCSIIIKNDQYDLYSVNFSIVDNTINLKYLYYIYNKNIRKVKLFKIMQDL